MDFTLNADLGRDIAAIYLLPLSGAAHQPDNNHKLALAHSTCLRHASIPALMVSESSKSLTPRMRRIQVSNHVDMRQVMQLFSMQTPVIGSTLWWLIPAVNAGFVVLRVLGGALVRAGGACLGRA